MVISVERARGTQRLSYPSKLVSLHLLLWFSAAKASLVDKVGELLLHEIRDFLDGLIESIFGLTRDVEIQWWALEYALLGWSFISTPNRQRTAAVDMLLSG